MLTIIICVSNINPKWILKMDITVPILYLYRREIIENVERLYALIKFQASYAVRSENYRIEVDLNRIRHKRRHSEMQNWCRHLAWMSCSPQGVAQGPGQ